MRIRHHGIRGDAPASARDDTGCEAPSRSNRRWVRAHVVARLLRRLRRALTDPRPVHARHSSFDDRSGTRFVSPIVNGVALLVVGLVAAHVLAHPRLATVLAILIAAVAGFVALPYLVLRGSIALVLWFEDARTVAPSNRRSETVQTARADD